MKRLFFIILLSSLFHLVYAEDKPTVHLATTEWPPYVSTNAPGFGYVYAIVANALQSRGYDTVIEFLPWGQAAQLHQNHDDAYFPEYDGNEIRQYACSDPIPGGPLGFFKRKDQPIQITVENPSKNQEALFNSLKTYRFGVVAGYKNTKAFDNTPDLIKVPVTNDLENLRQLKNGKVDLILIDIFVAEYLINQYYPEFSGLAFLGPSLENKKLYVCFSRTSPDYVLKLAALNQGLKELKETGRLQQIMSAD